jgi:hypothetical protein
MTAIPPTDEKDGWNLSGLIEEELKNRADSGSMNRLAALAMKYLVRLVIGVAHSAFEKVVSDALIAKQATLVQMAALELRRNPEFIAEVRGDAEMNLDGRVSEIVDRKMIERENALLTLLARRRQRANRYMRLLALFGAVAGGVCATVVFFVQLQGASFIDETGTAWATMSATEQPVYFVSFVFRWAALAAVCGCFIGWIFDAVRRRSR